MNSEAEVELRKKEEKPIEAYKVATLFSYFRHFKVISNISQFRLCQFIHLYCSSKLKINLTIINGTGELTKIFLYWIIIALNTNALIRCSFFKVQKRDIDGRETPYYNFTMENGTPCDINGNKPRSVHILYICHPTSNNEVSTMFLL